MCVCDVFECVQGYVCIEIVCVKDAVCVCACLCSYMFEMVCTPGTRYCWERRTGFWLGQFVNLWMCVCPSVFLCGRALRL